MDGLSKKCVPEPTVTVDIIKFAGLVLDVYVKATIFRMIFTHQVCQVTRIGCEGGLARVGSYGIDAIGLLMPFMTADMTDC